MFALKFRAIVPAIALVVGANLFAVSVQAQSSNDIAERLRQIDQVLNDLQRAVYKGEAPPPRPAAPATTTPSPAGSARFADIEVRLSGLEEQLRSMTGPIETAEHRVNQIASRLDKLISDIDFRLTAIERKLADQPDVSAANGEPANAVNSQPVTDQTAPAQGTGTVVQTVVGDAAAGTQVLGTIPASDANAAGQQTAAVTPAAPPKPKGVLPEGTVKERYDFAYGLLRRLKMKDAEVALKEFLGAHETDPLADNARYWLGESYFSRRDYTQAASVFYEGYSKAPQGPKARDNLYKLGKSLARMDQKDDACASYDELLSKFNGPKDQTIRQRAMVDRTELGCQ